MRKPQIRRMQQQPISSPSKFPTVKLTAQNRMPDLLQMQAQLMGAAGDGMQENPRGASLLITPNHLVFGDRWLAGFLADFVFRPII